MIKRAVEFIKKLNVEAIKYLLVTLLFITFPYLIKVIVYALGIRGDIKLSEEFVNGTLFTYAISLTAPIWYTIEVLVNNKKHDNTQSKGTVPTTQAWVLMFIAALLYCAFYFLQKDITNEIFATTLSVIILLWAIIIAYKIHIKEIDVNEPEKQRKIDENKIQEQIKEVEEGNSSSNHHNGISGNLDESLDFENFGEEE